MSIIDASLQDIHKMLRDKQCAVSDVLHASLAQIEKVDSDINAFITLNKEEAGKRAEALQSRSADEEQGLLFGLPIGIKDNISTKALKTTCASKLLSNFEPLYDATAVENIRNADGLIIGKLNMDEFGMGSSNEKTAFGPVHNPWDLDYVPGGSSGGSAAAVASRQVYAALGSDTGGSIRQPAAFCGIVGLKPTYGLVSRFGLVAYASSLDQIGPLTRNVTDAAYMLQTLAGYDKRDSTSAQRDIPDYVSALTGDVQGLRIAVPKEYLSEGIDSDVVDCVKKALHVLEGMGAHISEVSFPHSEYTIPAYYIIAASEASSNLSRFDGVRYGVRADADNLLDLYRNSRSEGFGNEVKRRIMLGTYSLSSGYYDAYYLQAQKVRTLIKQDYDRIFDEHDVVIGPTAPTTAYRLGEKLDDPLKMYLEDILTCPVNMAGIPAISVPCGFSAANGMPVGMQIAAPAFDESTVLRVAHAFEQATDHHRQVPRAIREGQA